MTPTLGALAAAAGTYLLYTRVVFGWRPLVRHRTLGRDQRLGAGIRGWLAQSGLVGIRGSELAIAVTLLFIVGCLAGWTIFGGPLPALFLGSFAAGFPVAALRRQRQRRMVVAQETWPRLIEEIRILTGAAGRSIPQALIDVGRRAPTDLQPAFEAAHREWLLSTDFARMLTVLKDQLVDPTADAACETLLVAHELGGADLDRRLEALAEDRRQDIQGRKDARAKQAGARFARRFVLVVPLGMALAGMSVGNGRVAYQTALGQLLVLVALGLVVLCWVWAGLVMALPRPERVFVE